MSRAALLEQLEAAKRHMNKGELDIFAQKQIIATLELVAHDTSEAKKIWLRSKMHRD
jgi:hypothetical protein